MLRKAESLFLQFMIAALVGWVYEIIATYIIYHKYYDRGILHLPLCPIYGVGALILTVFLGKIRSAGAQFALGTLITAAFEWCSAWVLETVFGLYLWTYQGWPLSFQDRISLVSSMIFGVLAVLFLKGVRPGVEAFCQRVGPARVHWITGGILAVCAVVELRMKF